MHGMESKAPESSGSKFPKEQRLRRRLEFSQTMNAGTKVVMPLMVLIARRVETSPARVGFIVSKKVGGAVERNHVKRRLRELYRSTKARPERIDLVVIARPQALHARFEDLSECFREGLRRVAVALERGEKPRAGATRAGTSIPESLRRVDNREQSV